jgi:hypothetical protein
MKEYWDDPRGFERMSDIMELDGIRVGSSWLVWCKCPPAMKRWGLLGDCMCGCLPGFTVRDTDGEKLLLVANNSKFSDEWLTPDELRDGYKQSRRG